MAPVDAQLAEFSDLVTGPLAVKNVQIKLVAYGKQIILTVADGDLARILATRGVAA